METHRADGLRVWTKTVEVHDWELDKHLFVETMPSMRDWFDINNGGYGYADPFSSIALAGAGGERLWLFSPNSAEVRGYSVDGALEVVARAAWSRVPVTREDERRWREFAMGRRVNPASRRRQLDHHRRIEFPDSLPLFEDIQVDPDGNVWLARFEPPWSGEDRVWEVVSRDGEWLGSVRLPVAAFVSCARRRPMSIRCRAVMFTSRTHVLTRQVGELGEQRVMLFRIQKRED